MKFNTKDTLTFLFIFIFIIEGIAHYRLNQLEKVTKQLIEANHALYELYRVDRQLNALEQIERDVGGFLEGTINGEIYPKKKKN
jgi:hypothetical protein